MNFINGGALSELHRKVIEDTGKNRKRYLELAMLARKSVEKYVATYLEQQLEQQKARAEYNSLDQELSKELIARGWFFSPEWPTTAVREFSKTKKERGMDGVIKEIIEFYSDSENVKATCEEIIGNSLISNERKSIIEEAFTAHLERKYNLSVPIFLIQAEGLFIEQIQAELYKNKKKVMSRFRGSHDIYSSMIDSFADFIQLISKSYGPSKNVPPLILNRHIILHGRSVDYGTIENSIKGILLIEYVLNMIKLINEGKASQGIR